MPSASPSPLAGEGGRREAAAGRGSFRPSIAELHQRAKYMRANPTDAEKRIWSLLRAKRMVGHKFRRQVVLDSYIVDFVCFRHRLIIEVDGGQHSENDYDRCRDAYFRRQGFRVSRFWNNDVLSNSDGVGVVIFEMLASPHPPTAARRAPPSPARGEGLVEAPLRMLA